MTPAVQTAYIHLTTGKVTAGLTGSQPPDINLILRTGGRLNFAFVDVLDGENVIVELEADTTGIFVIKAEDDADGDPLFRDTTMEKEGDDEDARYWFYGLIDSDDLRAALAGVRSIKLVGQVEFTQPSDDDASSSDAFDLTVKQNYNRDTDTAPVISDDVELIINAEADAVEVKINGVSKGFLLLVSDPHP